MLFCPSFTRSIRFLQTDQLVTRLQRVETTCCKVVPNFIRVMMGNVTVNVMETDAVFWWATIFCTSSPPVPSVRVARPLRPPSSPVWSLSPPCLSPLLPSVRPSVRHPVRPPVRPVRILPSVLVRPPVHLRPSSSVPPSPSSVESPRSVSLVQRVIRQGFVCLFFLVFFRCTALTDFEFSLRSCGRLVVLLRPCVFHLVFVFMRVPAIWN